MAGEGQRPSSLESCRKAVPDGRNRKAKGSEKRREQEEEEVMWQKAFRKPYCIGPCERRENFAFQACLVVHYL